MAMTKVSDYAKGNSNWDELLTTIEKQRKGYNGISLTHYDDTSLPAVAAGSYFEISGALYYAATEQAISGSPSSGNVNYIYIDGSTFVATWTTTAPTWSDAKTGWYDAGETDRYLGGCYYDGSDYTRKWVYEVRTIKEDNIQDAAVTNAKIGAAAVTNAKMAANAIKNAQVYWEDSSSGLWSLNPGADYVLPAGLYTITVTDTTIRVQVQVSSSWYGVEPPSGAVYSDGTNVRLHNGSVNPYAAYYIKLA